MEAGTAVAMTTTANAAAAAPDNVVALPRVFVRDALLPEPQRATVNNFLRADGWKFGWKSHAKTDEFAFWHKHFAGHRKGRQETKYDCAEELGRTAPLMFAFWSWLEKGIFKGHTLVRCYANGQSYGTDGTIHTDSKSDRSYTAVYYPHAVWEPNWAGETVLFNADKTDIIGSIYPKPNRLAVFKGNIPHLARGVSRTCPELRITAMFKTMQGPLDGDADD